MRYKDLAAKNRGLHPPVGINSLVMYVMMFLAVRVVIFSCMNTMYVYSSLRHTATCFVSNHSLSSYLTVVLSPPLIDWKYKDHLQNR